MKEQLFINTSEVPKVNAICQKKEALEEAVEKIHSASRLLVGIINYFQW